MVNQITKTCFFQYSEPQRPQHYDDEEEEEEAAEGEVRGDLKPGKWYYRSKTKKPFPGSYKFLEPTAAEFLAATPAKAEVWVVSDLQASNWAPDDDRWSRVLRILGRDPE